MCLQIQQKNLEKLLNVQCHNTNMLPLTYVGESTIYTNLHPITCWLSYVVYLDLLK